DVDELTLALVEPGETTLPAADEQVPARLSESRAGGRTELEVGQPSRTLDPPWSAGGREVLLLVPTDLALALAARRRAGDVQAGGEFTALEVHSDAGDLRLGPLSAPDGVRASTGAGDVDLELVSPAPTAVDVTATTGDVDVLLPTDAGGRVAVTADVGDIEVAAPGTGRWRVRAESAVGEVRADPGREAGSGERVGTLTVTSEVESVDIRRCAPVARASAPAREPLLDQIHHRGVGEGLGVPHLAVLGDVAQQAPHDLPRTGLGQLGDQEDLLRLGDRADLLAHVGAQQLGGLLVAAGSGDLLLVAPAQDPEGDRGLAGGLVVRADHGGRGGPGVADQRGLDLHGGQTMPGDVHAGVDAAEQPDVAVLVPLGAVTGEVEALVAGPVGLLEALRIAPDAAQHARPGFVQHQVAALAVRDGLPRVVDHVRTD